MTPSQILFALIGYFLILITISWITSKNNDKTSFYTGNRKSPWFLVAFGMIGASLSGVTFLSVPGWVAIVILDIYKPYSATWSVISSLLKS